MIRYTAKVRRGLAAMAELIDAAFDDNVPPVTTIVARWTKAKQAEFNLARDWVDQETEQPDVCEPAVEIAASPVAMPGGEA